MQEGLGVVYGLMSVYCLLGKDITSVRGNKVVASTPLPLVTSVLYLCHCEKSTSGGRRSNLGSGVKADAMRLLRFARNDIEDSSPSHLGVEGYFRNEIQV